jgi:homoserine dehydrogenase
VQGIQEFVSEANSSAGAEVTAMGVFADILKIQREA